MSYVGTVIHPVPKGYGFMITQDRLIIKNLSLQQHMIAVQLQHGQQPARRLPWVAPAYQTERCNLQQTMRHPRRPYASPQ